MLLYSFLFHSLLSSAFFFRPLLSSALLSSALLRFSQSDSLFLCFGSALFFLFGSTLLFLFGSALLLRFYLSPLFLGASCTLSLLFHLGQSNISLIFCLNSGSLDISSVALFLHFLLPQPFSKQSIR